jgi:hypothetical protein
MGEWKSGRVEYYQVLFSQTREFGLPTLSWLRYAVDGHLSYIRNENLSVGDDLTRAEFIDSWGNCISALVSAKSCNGYIFFKPQFFDFILAVRYTRCHIRNASLN